MSAAGLTLAARSVFADRSNLQVRLDYDRTQNPWPIELRVLNRGKLPNRHFGGGTEDIWAAISETRNTLFA